jgi:large subunit ribosomal protein L13
MKTTTTPTSAPAWYLIDADGQSIGKISVKAASILRGKHKVTFSPHQAGDQVVIINAAKLALPPKKGLRKTYHRHTGYPGNMKHTRLTDMIQKDPEYVLEHAITGMLEANRLRRTMMKRLHIFADDQHPYAAQKPQAVPVSRTK